MNVDVCWGNLRERDHLKYPGVDRRMILKWIFRKGDGSMDWIDLAKRQGQIAGASENSEEPSGSKK